MTDPNRLVVGFSDNFRQCIAEAIEDAHLVPAMYADAEAAIAAMRSEVAPLAVIASLGCKPYDVSKRTPGLLVIGKAASLQIPTALIGYPFSGLGLQHVIGGSLPRHDVYLGSYPPMGEPKPAEQIFNHLAEWLGRLTQVAA